MASARTGTRRAVGLRDIAEELNLSVSMVSKVLNGRMGTSGSLPATVRLIRDKAREMGYQKNLQAQALRTGRVNVIAVCVHHHGVRGSLIVEAMVEGIAREAANFQQRLVLHYYETFDELRKIWSDFSRIAVDGVILGGIPHVDWLRQVTAAGEPDMAMVTILPAEIAEGCTNVGMSEREICRRATAHLIDCGCRDIAHFRVTLVNEHTFSPSISIRRFEGYRQALQERGMPVRDELIIPTHQFHYECGLEATRRLLASGVKFDGIVGQSDHQIAAALNVLTERGVRVPDDVRLIGVDDSPFCEMASVPLSSVSQEFRIRGQMAVRMLMRKVDGEEAPSVVIEPVLSVRRSTSASLIIDRKRLDAVDA